MGGFITFPWLSLQFAKKFKIKKNKIICVGFFHSFHDNICKEKKWSPQTTFQNRALYVYFTNLMPDY